MAEVIRRRRAELGLSLATHPEAHLLARLPHVGHLSHAQLLAELGPILDRASSAEHAAAEPARPRSPARRARPAASTSA